MKPGSQHLVALLEQSLRSPSAASRLPEIQMPGGPSWLSKVWDWLQSLMPKFQMPPLGTDFVNWLVALLHAAIRSWPWLVAAVLIILGALIVQRIIQSARSSGRIAVAETIQTAEIGLPELTQAMLDGAWPHAARIRWKLFLRRKNLPVALTPREFANKDYESLTRAVRLMFGESDSSAPRWYQQMDEFLRSLEGEARSA